MTHSLFLDVYSINSSLDNPPAPTAKFDKLRENPPQNQTDRDVVVKSHSDHPYLEAMDTVMISKPSTNPIGAHYSSRRRWEGIYP